MNPFRLLFQVFLIFVFFSGIYVIFWLHSYHESFTEGVDEEPTDEPTIMDSTNTDAPIDDAPISDAPVDDAPITDVDTAIPIDITTSSGSAQVTTPERKIVITGAEAPDASVATNEVNQMTTAYNAVITTAAPAVNIVTTAYRDIASTMAPVVNFVTTAYGGFDVTAPTNVNLITTAYGDYSSTADESSDDVNQNVPEVTYGGDDEQNVPEVTYGQGDDENVPEVTYGQGDDENVPDVTYGGDDEQNVITTETPTDYETTARSIRERGRRPGMVTTLASADEPDDYETTARSMRERGGRPGMVTTLSSAEEPDDYPDQGRHEEDHDQEDESQPASESSSEQTKVTAERDAEQSLDDYVLKQHPVKLKEKPTSPEKIDLDHSKFITASPAYPKSSYGPFDPLSQDVNHYEYIAKEYKSSQPDGLSDNPMDPNWGGVMYTQNVIKSGKYSENNVKKPLLFQPKGIFVDTIPSGFEKPKDIY